MATDPPVDEPERRERLIHDPPEPGTGVSIEQRVRLFLELRLIDPSAPFIHDQNVEIAKDSLDRPAIPSPYVEPSSYAD